MRTTTCGPAPCTRRLDVGLYLVGLIASLPIVASLLVENLRGDSPPCLSSLSRHRWEHGWPLTFMWRKSVVGIDLGPQGWRYRQLPFFWSPRWPWWDMRYGNQCYRFEVYPLVADVLLTIVISCGSAYCAAVLACRTAGKIQFSLRIMLLLTLLFACAMSLLTLYPPVLDAILEFLPLCGSACAVLAVLVLVVRATAPEEKTAGDLESKGGERKIP